MLDAGTPVLFYSTLGTSKLAIQGRGLPFTESDVVPLGFKSTVASTYEVRLSNFDGIFDAQQVYLEDRLLHVIHNLKTSNYTFTTAAGTFDDRFVLRYTDAALSVADQSFTDASVVVYKNNETVHITSLGTAIADVKIFDIRGSLLYSKTKANTNEVLVSTLASSQQLLLVTVTSVDGSVVTKKIQF